MVKESTIYTS